MRVQFVTKDPHETLGLNVWADANDEPRRMYEALTKIGWVGDTLSPAPFAAAESYHGAGYARGDQTTIVCRNFHKVSAKREEKTFVSQCRTLLRKFGFIRIDHQKLTSAGVL